MEERIQRKTIIGKRGKGEDTTHVGNNKENSLDVLHSLLFSFSLLSSPLLSRLLLSSLSFLISSPHLSTILLTLLLFLLFPLLPHKPASFYSSNLVLQYAEFEGRVCCVHRSSTCLRTRLRYLHLLLSKK